MAGLHESRPTISSTRPSDIDAIDGSTAPYGDCRRQRMYLPASYYDCVSEDDALEDEEDTTTPDLLPRQGYGTPPTRRAFNEYDHTYPNENQFDAEMGDWPCTVDEVGEPDFTLGDPERTQIPAEWGHLGRDHPLFNGHGADEDGDHMFSHGQFGDGERVNFACGDPLGLTHGSGHALFNGGSPVDELPVGYGPADRSFIPAEWGYLGTDHPSYREDFFPHSFEEDEDGKFAARYTSSPLEKPNVGYGPVARASIPAEWGHVGRDHRLYRGDLSEDEVEYEDEKGYDEGVRNWHPTAGDEEVESLHMDDGHGSDQELFESGRHALDEDIYDRDADLGYSPHSPHSGPTDKGYDSFYDHDAHINDVGQEKPFGENRYLQQLDGCDVLPSWDRWVISPHVSVDELGVYDGGREAWSKRMVPDNERVLEAVRGAAYDTCDRSTFYPEPTDELQWDERRESLSPQFDQSVGQNNYREEMDAFDSEEDRQIHNADSGDHSADNNPRAGYWSSRRHTSDEEEEFIENDYEMRRRFNGRDEGSPFLGDDYPSPRFQRYHSPLDSFTASPRGIDFDYFRSLADRSPSCAGQSLIEEPLGYSADWSRSQGQAFMPPERSNVSASSRQEHTSPRYTYGRPHQMYSPASRPVSPYSDLISYAGERNALQRSYIRPGEYRRRPASPPLHSTGLYNPSSPQTPYTSPLPRKGPLLTTLCPISRPISPADTVLAHPRLYIPRQSNGLRFDTRRIKRPLPQLLPKRYGLGYDVPPRRPRYRSDVRIPRRPVPVIAAHNYHRHDLPRDREGRFRPGPPPRYRRPISPRPSLPPPHPRSSPTYFHQTPPPIRIPHVARLVSSPHRPPSAHVRRPPRSTSRLRRLVDNLARIDRLLEQRERASRKVQSFARAQTYLNEAELLRSRARSADYARAQRRHQHMAQLETHRAEMARLRDIQYRTEAYCALAAEQRAFEHELHRQDLLRHEMLMFEELEDMRAYNRWLLMNAKLDDAERARRIAERDQWQALDLERRRARFREMNDTRRAELGLGPGSLWASRFDRCPRGIYDPLIRSTSPVWRGRPSGFWNRLKSWLETPRSAKEAARHEEILRDYAVRQREIPPRPISVKNRFAGIGRPERSLSKPVLPTPGVCTPVSARLLPLFPGDRLSQAPRSPGLRDWRPPRMPTPLAISARPQTTGRRTSPPRAVNFDTDPRPPASEMPKSPGPLKSAMKSPKSREDQFPSPAPRPWTPWMEDLRVADLADTTSKLTSFSNFSPEEQAASISRPIRPAPSSTLQVPAQPMGQASSLAGPSLTVQPQPAAPHPPPVPTTSATSSLPPPTLPTTPGIKDVKGDNMKGITLSGVAHLSPDKYIPPRSTTSPPSAQNSVEARSTSEQTPLTSSSRSIPLPYEARRPRPVAMMPPPRSPSVKRKESTTMGQSPSFPTPGSTSSGDEANRPSPQPAKKYTQGSSCPPKVSRERILRMAEKARAAAGAEAVEKSAGLEKGNSPTSK